MKNGNFDYIGELREHHRQLVEALARIDQSISDSRPPETIRRAATDLAGALGRHFRYEEHLMKILGVARAGQHGIEHRIIIAGFVGFMQSNKADDGMLSFLPYIIAFLRHALVDHEENFDIHLVRHLEILDCRAAVIPAARADGNPHCGMVAGKARPPAPAFP